MKCLDYIYIQNQNCCLRNKKPLNIRINGDLCIFSRPQYVISGATTIQPLNSGDTGVYIVNNNDIISFLVTFNNIIVENYADVEVYFEIYSYNQSLNCFNIEPLLTYGPYNLTNLSNCGQNFNDWYLPTSKELLYIYSILYNNIINPIEFSNDIYWSCNDSSYDKAIGVDFSNELLTTAIKNVPKKIRPVRSFIDNDFQYDLYDDGPANGVIFGVEYNGGNRYVFECYRYDLTPNVWATDLLFENLPNDFGDGFQNSEIIKNNYLDSAAKTCRDFSIQNNDFCLELNIPVLDLNPDNEYIIKPYFKFKSCNFIGNILGYEYDDKIVGIGEYCQYNSEYDYYFLTMINASIPQFDFYVGNISNFGNLISYSIILTENQMVVQLPSFSNNGIISLNGLVLSRDYDYTLSGLTLTFLGDINKNDILTVVHVSSLSNASNFTHDFIVVNNIPSGPMNQHGNNKVYFNQTTNKYEIYTDVSINPNDDIILTINGSILSPNVDYYLSITNHKRIILDGTIELGDVINIYYHGVTDYVHLVYSTNPLVKWYIDTIPQNENGYFILELATDINFNEIIYSYTVNYQIGVSFYSAPLEVNGNIGDTYYYRVKNVKFYTPIEGNTITSIAYSEIIPITIGTNAINSY